MKRKYFALLTVSLTALVMAGCVGTIDVRHKVGVPLVKDKVERRYERAPQDIWTAAKDVLKYNGVLYGEDILKATLEASVDTRTVWIRVQQEDAKFTKLLVQVRTKLGAPDVDLAGQLAEQIAVRLATGNLTPAARPNAF